MRWLKLKIQRWLDIPKDQTQRNVLESRLNREWQAARQLEFQEMLKIADARIDDAIRRADYDLLLSRFETLLDLLGVEIVADCVSGNHQHTAVSTRPTSLIGDAERYLNAATSVEQMLALQHHMLRQYAEFAKDLKWRKN